MKNIDVCYHWIRDMLEDKLLQLEKVHANENWSNMITKVIPAKKFEDRCQRASVVVPPN